MFETLQTMPADAILGLIAEHRDDPRPEKIDLGVGVYRDANGETPILSSVKQAEKRLLATPTSKSYLGTAGDPQFNARIQDLAFADSVDSQRLVTIQTPGGSGSLRVAAGLLLRARDAVSVWVSQPTWANHVPLLGGAGLELKPYPYYDTDRHVIDVDGMLDALHTATAGDAVLLHACCHNPSGLDPTDDDWRAIIDVIVERGLLPFIDMAYQGFERGVEEDALAVRLFAEKCPEMLVASSCSKNFALYRERVGAISVVCADSAKAGDVETVVHALTRKNYSMPPAHGTGIVDIILHSEELTALWREEVTGMRNRINGLRSLLVEKMAAAGIERDFSFLERQSGMFSFMGLNVEQVQRLRDEFSIYTVNSARVNIASFNDGNIDYFVEALKVVLEE